MGNKLSAEKKSGIENISEVLNYEIPENNNREIFIEFDNITKKTSLKSNYSDLLLQSLGYNHDDMNIYNYIIKYRRFVWNVSLSYNEIVSLDRVLVGGEFYDYIRNLQRPIIHAKYTNNSNYINYRQNFDSDFDNNRSKIVLKYLQEIVDIDKIFKGSAPLKRLLRLSDYSLNPDFGRKGKEGFLLKCSSTRSKKVETKTDSNEKSDPSERKKKKTYMTIWHDRWFILFDTCICWYSKPENKNKDDFDEGPNNNSQLRGSLLVNEGFEIISGDLEDTSDKNFSITSNNGYLNLRAHSYNCKLTWITEIKEFYKDAARLQLHPFKASYPIRSSNILKYYFNSHDYFIKVAKTLLSAKREIFICSSKLSPCVFLSRPPNPPIRLDHILKFKANQGVQIYILYSKELVSKGNDNVGSLLYLKSLSVNIHVIRHPNKLKDMSKHAETLWTHNEKIIIIDRLTALISTTDLSYTRYDNNNHPLVDVEALVFPGKDYKQPAHSFYRSIKDEKDKVNNSNDANIDIDFISLFEAEDNLNSKDVDENGISFADFGIKYNYSNEMQSIVKNEIKSIIKNQDSSQLKRKNSNKKDKSKTNLLNILSDQETANHDFDQNEESEETSSNAISDKNNKSHLYSDGLFLDLEVEGHKESTKTLSQKEDSSIFGDEIVSEKTSNRIKAKTELRDSVPRMGNSDYSILIAESIAVRDLSNHFIERWNYHRKNASLTYNEPTLIDATDVTKFSCCAKCDLNNIDDYESICPSCHYNLGPVGSFIDDRTDIIPSFPSEYSFITFTGKFKLWEDFPFEINGSCPCIITTVFNKTDKINCQYEIVESNCKGSLSTDNLANRVGDILVSVGDVCVSHLNYLQLYRYIDCLRNSLPNEEQRTIEVVFRRHIIEVDNISKPVKLSRNQTAARLLLLKGLDQDDSPNFKKILRNKKRMKSIRIIPEVSNSFNPLCDAQGHREIEFMISSLFHSEVNLNDDKTLSSGNVQILRSVGKWSVRDKTECSILNGWIESITESTKFIYMESQTLISCSIYGNEDFTNANNLHPRNRIAKAIVDKILEYYFKGEPFKVIIVLPMHPKGDFVRSVKARLTLHYQTITIKWMLEYLQNKAPHIIINEYINFYSLRNWGLLNHSIITNQVYVNGSVLIVDDKRLILGSASISDRGMLGDRNSELAVSISNNSDQVHSFPQNFRLQLMRQHISDLDNENIIDPFNNTWQTIADSNTHIYNTIIDENSLFDCKTVKSFNKLLRKKLKSNNDINSNITNISTQGFLVNFPINLLADENLFLDISKKESIPASYWF